MRIALFAWDSFDSVFVGGAGVHVSELARVLAKRGHEVHLFTRVAPEQVHYEQRDGVFLHRCAFDHDRDFVRETRNMCRSFEHHFFTTRALAGEFDIVHAHDWLTADVLSLIKRQCSARRVLNDAFHRIQARGKQQARCQARSNKTAGKKANRGE